MEDSLLNQIWPLQMSHHVLQTLQFPSNILNNEEHNFPRPDHHLSCHHIHGQHPSVHQDNQRTPPSHHPSYRNPTQKQPVPQTNEMPIQS